MKTPTLPDVIPHRLPWQKKRLNKVAVAGVYNIEWPRPKGLSYEEASKRGLMVSQQGPSAWESDDPLCKYDNPGNLVWSLGARTLLGSSSELSMKQNDWENDQSLSALFIATGPLLDGVRDSRVSYIQELLGKVEKPTVIVGMGVSSFSGTEEFKCSNTLDAETKDMLDNLQMRINEYGGFVGLRGSCAEQLLSHHGYVGFEQLGCPSLYINTKPELGMKLHNKFSLLTEQLAKSPQKLKIAIAMPKSYDQRIIPLLASILLAFPESSLVSQEPNSDELFEQACKELGVAKPTREILMFYDAFDWRNKMAQMDLVVSARIHGGMISIAAETPTIVIPPDMRVKELVDAMLLPHVLPARASGLLNLADLVTTVSDEFDGGAFDLRRKEFAARYLELFNDVGLALNPEVAALALVQLQAIPDS